MPVYDYRCAACTLDFTESRPMYRYQEPAPCPQCGHAAARLITAPRLNILHAHLRLAHQTNERSAHQPRVTRAHQCGPGCGHAATAHLPLRQANGPKRPWMLGH